MRFQLGEIEQYQLQGIATTVGAVGHCKGNIRLHVLPRFLNGLSQKSHVLVGAFETVKRSFELIHDILSAGLSRGVHQCVLLRW